MSDGAYTRGGTSTTGWAAPQRRLLDARPRVRGAPHGRARKAFEDDANQLRQEARPAPRRTLPPHQCLRNAIEPADGGEVSPMGGVGHSCD